ncbi:MAG TPA: autotransporter outer membrane beta-barrel domain-containing protein, partial [Methylotenera sp.]|nr:autotransporter outer membrane beta-barrel domain-containing protein [Methylotenera sp.]
QSLNNTQGLMNTGKYLSALPFNGAHHRPLLLQKNLNNRRCVWMVGDLASYDHQEDGNAQLAEVGGCVDLLPQRLRFGIGVGKSYADLDFDAIGTNSDVDGQYLISELDYAMASLPLMTSLTGYVGRHDADVTRAYLNGGSTDASLGDTDINTYALRARLDWLNAFALSKVQFSPRISYTVSRIDIDGYTETSGGFPVRFDSRKDTTHELRYGVDAEWQAGEATWLRAMVEGVHRLDNDESNISGNVLGLFEFSLPGNNNKTNWSRIGGEVEHYFSPDLRVLASLNASSSGEDPDVSGGINLAYSF